MARLACILVLASLCAPRQETELSIEQELDALIEKTNSLESFHAVYRGKTRKGEEDVDASFDLAYQAPDRARARMSVTGGPEEGTMDGWIVGRRSVWRVERSGQEEWRCMELPDPPESSRVLDGLFPRPERALEPGASLFIEIVQGEETSLQLSFQNRLNGRDCVLGWLAEIKKQAADVDREPHELVWSGDRFRCLLSRESGFLTRIEIEKPGQQVAIVLLEELRLDEPIDPALLELPAEARDLAPDEELQRGLYAQYAPGRVRQYGFLRLERLLRSQERSWNEVSRADWRAFLQVLHREMIVQRYSKWLEELRRGTEELVDRVRSGLTDDPSPAQREEFQARVEEYRGRLEESFDKAENLCTESLPAVESESLEPRQELFDVELEVLESLFDELLRRPILEEFDARLAEAFG